MPDLVAVWSAVCARVTQLRAIRSDERGEVTLERTVLTAVLAGLALIIVSLGLPALTRVLTGS
jgi:hypothetical protein